MEEDRLVDIDAFASRLRELIYPEKHSAFAERAGISMSVLSKYLSPPKGLSPSVEMIARVCKASSTSMDWLVMGVGDSASADADLWQVPIYNIRLAAGGGAFSSTEKVTGQMPFDKGFLASLGYNSNDGLAVVEAEGDSMEPEIVSGARVLIDRNDRRLREAIFAFRLGDDLRLKRLRPVGLGDVEAISSNAIYPSEIFQGEMRDHFEILGRAVWAGREL